MVEFTRVALIIGSAIRYQVGHLPSKDKLQSITIVQTSGLDHLDLRDDKNGGASCVVLEYLALYSLGYHAIDIHWSRYFLYKSSEDVYQK